MKLRLPRFYIDFTGLGWIEFPTLIGPLEAPDIELNSFVLSVSAMYVVMQYLRS